MEKDPLWELIHSMTQNEKRYFSRFSKRYNEDKNQDYLNLFHVLEQATIYDETAIKSKLKNETFARNLSVGKVYLYEQILKCLRNYHSNNNPSIQLHDLLIDIELLVERNLIKQSEKRIKKAKKLAARFHYDELMLEILKNERTLIRSYQSQNLEKQIKANQSLTNYYLKQLNATFNVMELYDRIFFMIRNRGTLQDPLKEVGKVMTEFGSKTDPSKFAFQAKLIYHLIWTNYYSIIANNVQEAKIHLKIILDNFDEDQELKTAYPLRYINVVTNYLNLYYLDQNFDPFPKYLESIKNITARNPFIQLKIFQNDFYLRFIHALGINNYPLAYSYIPEAEAGLKKFKDKIDKVYHLVFLQSFAIAGLFNEQYSESIDWANAVLLDKKHDLRPDVVVFCRLLIILNHYELENENLVESLATALSRYIKKNLPQDKALKLLCKYILFALPLKKSERIAIFKNAHHDISRIEGYFNGKQEVLFWLKNQFIK